MYWHEPLSYFITPRSGPVRPMKTLEDARSALVHDLPSGGTRRPHWMAAGQRVVAASESGTPEDIQAATDALVVALEVEGWMSKAASVRGR